MNKIYKFIGILFVTAFLMAIPMLFILSICCLWHPFIITILTIFTIGEFILGALDLYQREPD